MTVREALAYGTKQLTADGRHLSPVLDSEVLLSFVTGMTKAELYAEPKRVLALRQIKKYKELIRKRSEDQPIAYLTGKKEFCGLEFAVNPSVLIPRPETETLVETLAERLNERRRLKIADIGTGSGCIVISLAVKLPGNQYFASDISAESLTTARQNAKTHQVNIIFKRSDLLSAWKKRKIDVIIANLPYGWKAWKNNTTAETAGLKYEPKEALFAEEKGLKVIRQLLEQLSERREIKLIALEHDPRQHRAIKKLAEMILPAYRKESISDLTGKKRFLLLAQKSF